MSTIDDGGSAFPVTAEQSVSGAFPEGGLTKREWFTGMAMQSLILHPYIIRAGIPDEAYRLADEMIAAGKVKP